MNIFLKCPLLVDLFFRVYQRQYVLSTLSKSSSLNIQLRFQPGILEQYPHVVISKEYHRRCDSDQPCQYHLEGQLTVSAQWPFSRRSHHIITSWHLRIKWQRMRFLMPLPHQTRALTLLRPQLQRAYKCRSSYGPNEGYKGWVHEAHENKPSRALNADQEQAIRNYPLKWLLCGAANYISS